MKRIEGYSSCDYVHRHCWNSLAILTVCREPDMDLNKALCSYTVVGESAKWRTHNCTIAGLKFFHRALVACVTWLTERLTECEWPNSSAQTLLEIRMVTKKKMSEVWKTAKEKLGQNQIFLNITYFDVSNLRNHKCSFFGHCFILVRDTVDKELILGTLGMRREYTLDGHYWRAPYTHFHSHSHLGSM